MPFHAPNLYQNIDEVYMARCLALAELGQGTVSPNPLVGCVVLDAQGRVVGEGYHQRAGEAHAEVIALNQAGERAHGGTLYVNLEPCNHQGRTPPCTQKIISAGIQRVVCGTLDPNPLVAGAGRDALQNSRISVRYGFLEKECKLLNEKFFHYILYKTPFVTVKLGMSLDGKIANRHGESRWLTGSFARQYVHHLRQEYDAILTTAETVIADNPTLNVRDIPNIRKQPVRIVLDRQFRLNVERYEVFKGEKPAWIVTSAISHNKQNAQKAKAMGIKVIKVDEIGGALNLKALFALLPQENIASVFVEAGGRLASSILNEGLANKYYLFYAPKTLQDTMSKPAFGHTFQLELPDAPQLEIIQSRQLEQDWVLEAQPKVKPKPPKANGNSNGSGNGHAHASTSGEIIIPAKSVVHSGIIGD